MFLKTFSTVQRFENVPVSVKTRKVTFLKSAVLHMCTAVALNSFSDIVQVDPQQQHPPDTEWVSMMKRDSLKEDGCLHQTVVCLHRWAVVLVE